MTKIYGKGKKFDERYGDQMVTPTGRAVWVWLNKPQPPMQTAAGEDPGRPKYGLTLLFDKKDSYSEKWIKAVEEMAGEMLKQFNAGKRTKVTLEGVVRDGDADEKIDLEKMPFYKGKYFIAIRNAKQPPVVNGQKQVVPVDSIEAGMLVRCTCTPMVGAWGISYQLNAVQFVKDDGTRYGGANREGSYIDMLPTEDAPTEEPEAQEAAEEETPVEESLKEAKTSKQRALDLL